MKLHCTIRTSRLSKFCINLSLLILLLVFSNFTTLDHSKVAPNKDLTPTVYHFVIMDSYGRLVKEGTFLQNQLKITISNLALRKGMYFINLTSPSNSQTVKFLSYE